MTTVRVLVLTVLLAVLGAAAIVPANASAHAGSSARSFRAVRVLETGPSRGITGFSVLFSRAPSRSSARRVANYAMHGVRPDGTRVRINLDRVDLLGRRVRVVADAPFGQAQFTRLVMQIRDGRKGLRDRRGRRLDGNRDGRPGGTAVFRFRLITGTTVRFTEHDGDRAELTIADGGRLDGIAPIGGPATQHTQFWILDPIARTSKLRGSVTTTAAASPLGVASGNGIVVISEISGLDDIIRSEFDSNPSFRVTTRTRPNNATGIG